METKITKKGTLISLEYDGVSKTIVIPDTVNCISRKFGLSLKDEPIEVVIIPESVITIENKTFYCWESLKKVIFTGTPKITMMGSECFSCCYSLEEFEVPDSVNFLLEYTFSGCEHLKRVKIGKETREIQESCFLGCDEIEKIEFAENGLLQSIEQNAFSLCKKLHDIKLPPDLDIIGKGILDKTAFYQDSSNWEDDILYNGEYIISARNNKNRKTITVKSGITLIADDTFATSENLESVYLSNTVKHIGKSAFKDCYKLNNISTMHSLKTIDREAFQNCKNLPYINLGEECCYLGSRAFEGCKKLKTIYYDYDGKALPTKYFDESFIGASVEKVIMNVQEDFRIEYYAPELIQEIMKRCKATLKDIFLRNYDPFPDDYDVKDLFLVR